MAASRGNRGTGEDAEDGGRCPEVFPNPRMSLKGTEKAEDDDLLVWESSERSVVIFAGMILGWSGALV
jgi:hypothetical protein